jgi:hypothetical protein
MRFKIVTFILTGLLLGAFLNSPAQKVDDLVGKGLAWLRTQQNVTGGYWTGYSADRVGATGLALQTFLAAGIKPQDDVTVQKGVEYLLSQAQSNGGIYNWSDEAGYQCAMAIAALKAAANYSPPNVVAINTAIANAKNYFIARQQTWSGGWRYSPHSYADYDLSISQWVILALEGESNPILWDRVRNNLLHNYCRHSSGGYRYQSGYGPTGTMTCAGIWGEAIAGGPQANIDAGFTWLKNNYGGNTQGIVNAYSNTDWTYYYIYGFSKACRLSSKTQLFGENWYDLMYQRINNLHQNAKSGEFIPEINTFISEISPGEMTEKQSGIQVSEEYKSDITDEKSDLVYWRNIYSIYETNVLATSWALLALQTGTVPPESKLSISLSDQGIPADCIDFTITNEFGYDAGVTPVTNYNNIVNSTWKETGQDYMEWEIELDAAGNYNTLIDNNCNQTKIFELCFRVYIENELVDEECFNDFKEFITVPPYTAISATAFVNAIGGLNVIIVNPPAIIPEMELTPAFISYNPFEYSHTYNFTFDVTETGGETALTNVDIFASKLTDEFENEIPYSAFTFTPNTIATVPAGGFVTVQGTLVTPASFVKADPGLFTGVITAQTTDQAKAINFEIGKPTMTVTPLASTVPNTAGSGNFTIDFTGLAGVDWDIAIDAPWLSANTMTGNGDATITFDYLINPTLNERIGTITVMAPNALNTGVNVVITQEPSTSIADQIIDLPVGWLGISSYIIPENPALEVVLDGVDENMQIMLGSTGIYWPSQNINTIGNWNTYIGYKVKMNQPALLEFYGLPAVPSVTFGAGLHYLPMLSENPVNAVDVFGPIGNDLLFAFNIQTGKIYWPSGGIIPPNPAALTTLEPGVGYLIRLLGTATFDFTAKATTAQNQVSTFVNNTPWNNVVKTGDAHIISIDKAALSDIYAGSVIGVFDASGKCVGMTEFADKSNNQALIVYGDDFTTPALEGLTEGEYLSLKLFTPSNGQVTDLVAVYDANWNTGTFEPNGLSLIKSLKAGALGIGNNPSKFEIYPNPSTGLFNILSGGKITVDVVNTTGQIVNSSNFDGNGTLDLTQAGKGVYYLRILSENGIRIEKIVIN